MAARQQLIHQKNLKRPTHCKNDPAVATYNGSTSAIHPPGALETCYTLQKTIFKLQITMELRNRSSQEELPKPDLDAEAEKLHFSNGSL